MKKLLLALALSLALAVGCQDSEDQLGCESDTVEVASKDTLIPDGFECLGSAFYCDCLGNNYGWANAPAYCACQEAAPRTVDFSCECCWMAFDEAAPEYGVWAPFADAVCTSSYYEDTPEGGCQD
jgi:hypothetical protein